MDLLDWGSRYTRVTPILNYVLANLKEDLILGMNWLKKEGVVIDTVQGGMYFGIEQRSVAYWDQSKRDFGQILPIKLEEINAEDDWRDHYEGIINEFPEIFREGLKQLRTTLAQHQIVVKERTPFKIKRYQYSVEKKQIIQDEVERMLKAGVVRRSRSPYSSPIVLVTKPNGAIRFCIDYRQLNKITEDEVA